MNKEKEVAIVDIGNDLKQSIEKLFTRTLGPVSLILKSSRDVYLKPNAVDFKPYSYTSTQVLKTLIEFLFDNGANNIYLMENCTQSNTTRLVFKFNGYTKLCKETGAIPLFLDEKRTTQVELENLKLPINIPTIIYEKLIKEKEHHTYINVPKLKTHSMSTVTLALKNQMAFVDHKNRAKLHDEEHLHTLFADVYSLIQPDYTLIDGTFAVFHGHYPLKAFLDQMIEPLNILIGGIDGLKTSIVAARVLGYSIEEVKHLKIACENIVPDLTLDKVDLDGDLNKYTKKYPFNIIDKFPDDVRIIRGTKKLCKEGCELNTLMLLQMLAYDFNGKGGFSILMGKGFSEKVLNSIEGPVLLSGKCAIEETYEVLKHKLGKKNVYCSPYCNSLALTCYALCKLMKLHPLDLVPSKIAAITALINSKIHRSKANTPPII
ncbi:MAG: DUF362 domain-containing protein [Candidatus Hodarchaeales archaeon]